MGTENSLFCAGKTEIPCAGTGFTGQKAMKMEMELYSQH